MPNPRPLTLKIGTDGRVRLNDRDVATIAFLHPTAEWDLCGTDWAPEDEALESEIEEEIVADVSVIIDRNDGSPAAKWAFDIEVDADDNADEIAEGIARAILLQIWPALSGDLARDLGAHVSADILAEFAARHRAIEVIANGTKMQPEARP